MNCNNTELAAAAAMQTLAAWNATLLPCNATTPGIHDDGAEPFVVPTSYARLVMAQAASRMDPTAAAGMIDDVLSYQLDSGLMPHLAYDLPRALVGANCSTVVYPPASLWAKNATTSKASRPATNDGGVSDGRRQLLRHILESGAGVNVDISSIATSGFPAPPIHASAVLDVFYRWYGGALALIDPAASSAGQVAALTWLRSSWDSLYMWHAWLWSNRVIGAGGGGGGGKDDVDDDPPALLLSLSPLESSLPYSEGWRRALRLAPNISTTHGCVTAAPALEPHIPPDIATGTAFPGLKSYHDLWCQTGCVIDCGNDAGCVALSCPLSGFVSAVDNALFAAASDDLFTISQWLTSPTAGSSGPSTSPLPPSEVADVTAWRGLTAQAMVDSLFRFNAQLQRGGGLSDNERANPHRPLSLSQGRDASGVDSLSPVSSDTGDDVVPCAGWVYDAILTLQPNVSSSVTGSDPFKLELADTDPPSSTSGSSGSVNSGRRNTKPSSLQLRLQLGTLQGHATASLGIVLPDEQDLLLLQQHQVQGDGDGISSAVARDVFSGQQRGPGSLRAGKPLGRTKDYGSLWRGSDKTIGPTLSVCPGVSWRDAVIATLLSPAFEAYPMAPSLSRQDPSYAPGFSFSGPVWLEANARVQWGLASPLNDGDAAIRELMAAETGQMICDASLAVLQQQQQRQGGAGGIDTVLKRRPPHPDASSSSSFFSAYDGTTGNPLSNSTAGFSDSFLAPAWALLLLAPSSSPVPLPQPIYGQDSLVVVMITEVVVVLLAAALCVVLGARQVRRLRLEQAASSLAEEEPDDEEDEEMGDGWYDNKGELGKALLGGDAADDDSGGGAIKRSSSFTSFLLLSGLRGASRDSSNGGGGGGGGAKRESSPNSPNANKPNRQKPAIAPAVAIPAALAVTSSPAAATAVQTSSIAASAMAHAAAAAASRRRRKARTAKGVRFADSSDVSGAGGEGGSRIDSTNSGGSGADGDDYGDDGDGRRRSRDAADFEGDQLEGHSRDSSSAGGSSYSFTDPSGSGALLTATAAANVIPSSFRNDKGAAAAASDDPTGFRPISLRQADSPRLQLATPTIDDASVSRGTPLFRPVPLSPTASSSSRAGTGSSSSSSSSSSGRFQGGKPGPIPLMVEGTRVSAPSSPSVAGGTSAGSAEAFSATSVGDGGNGSRGGGSWSLLGSITSLPSSMYGYVWAGGGGASNTSSSGETTESSESSQQQQQLRQSSSASLRPTPSPTSSSTLSSPPSAAASIDASNSSQSQRKGGAKAKAPVTATTGQRTPAASSASSSHRRLSMGETGRMLQAVTDGVDID